MNTITTTAGARAKARELQLQLDAYARTQARVEALNDLAVHDDATDPRQAYRVIREKARG